MLQSEPEVQVDYFLTKEGIDKANSEFREHTLSDDLFDRLTEFIVNHYEGFIGKLEEAAFELKRVFC